MGSIVIGFCFSQMGGGGGLGPVLRWKDRGSGKKVATEGRERISSWQEICKKKEKGKPRGRNTGGVSGGLIKWGKVQSSVNRLAGDRG